MPSLPSTPKPGQEFTRARRRAAGLRRAVEAATDDAAARSAAWARRSAAHDQAEALARRIERRPVTNMVEFATAFDALLWTLFDDRRDWPEARRLRRLERALRRVIRRGDAI